MSVKTFSAVNKLPCPSCRAPAFGWWDKYLAAKWKILTCPHCGARVCSQPLLLAFYYLLSLWDVLLFGYVAYLKSDPFYLGVMAAGWLLLDAFSLYLPLAALRRQGAPGT